MEIYAGKIGYLALEAAGVHKSVQSVKESCSEVTCEFQRFFPMQFSPRNQKLEPISILTVFEVELEVVRTAPSGPYGLQMVKI